VTWAKAPGAVISATTQTARPFFRRVGFKIGNPFRING